MIDGEARKALDGRPDQERVKQKPGRPGKNHKGGQEDQGKIKELGGTSTLQSCFRVPWSMGSPSIRHIASCSNL